MAGDCSDSAAYSEQYRLVEVVTFKGVPIYNKNQIRIGKDSKGNFIIDRW